MLIQLNTINYNQQPNILYLDNHTYQLYDKDHKLIDLKNDQRISEILNQYKTQRQKNNITTDGTVTLHGKSNQVRNLKIQLGMKCNMNCSYCAQANNRNEEVYNFNASFVNNFIDKLKKNNITVAQSIHLWGGEPFVYWKTLVKLIPALRELYPHVYIGMITNGTLLTKDKIDWLKQYDCSITLSHDGPGYYLRGSDPLDDPKMLEIWRYAFTTLLDVNINCVITPANIDLISIRDFFTEKFENVYVNFEGIMTHLGNQDSQLAFTAEQLDQLSVNIFDAVANHDWNEFPGLRNISLRSLRLLTQKFGVDKNFVVRCDMACRDTFAVNLRGDVLSCHDFCQPEKFVGHIDFLEDVDLQPHFKNALDYERCSSCPVLGICNGTCPQMDKNAHCMTCRNEFAYNMSVFRAIIWLILGEQIISFETHK